MGGIGGWSGYGGYGNGQLKEKFSEDDSRNQGEAGVLGHQDNAALEFPRCAKGRSNQREMSAVEQQVVQPDLSADTQGLQPDMEQHGEGQEVTAENKEEEDAGADHI